MLDTEKRKELADKRSKESPELANLRAQVGGMGGTEYVFWLALVNAVEEIGNKLEKLLEEKENNG